MDFTSEKMNPYEIWFIKHNDHVLYVPTSIGKLLLKDLRSNSLIKSISLHESEISCIEIEDNSVFCGSFDGTISHTDLRNFKCFDRDYVGGGVWRMIKKQNGFITANMEEGFKYTEKNKQSQILTGSLAYGLEEIGNNQFIGCSFYDSTLIKFDLIS